MKQRSSSSGISLLEVLISLAIMSGIAIALAAIGQTGNRLWPRIAVNDAFVEAALVRSTVRDDFANLPLVSSDRSLSDIAVFEADRIVLLEKPDKPVSVLSWRENALTFQRGDGQSTPRLLYDKPTGLTVQFFGQKFPRAERQWSEDWTSASLLPELIKIESYDARGEPNPPLVLYVSRVAIQREISLSSLLPPG